MSLRFRELLAPLHHCFFWRSLLSTFALHRWPVLTAPPSANRAHPPLPRIEAKTDVPDPLKITTQARGDEMTDIEALAEKVPGVDPRAVLRGAIELDETAIVIIDPAENGQRARPTKIAADTGIVTTGIETAIGHLADIDLALQGHPAVQCKHYNDAAHSHLNPTPSPRPM